MYTYVKIENSQSMEGVAGIPQFPKMQDIF